MTLDLSALWHSVEAGFSLSGPRRAVRELLGIELATALEEMGLLVPGRAAERYPCPSLGGEGCPRVVTKTTDQGFVALCGMNPPECSDMELSPKDVQIVALDSEALVEATGRALQIRTRVEVLPHLRCAYRVGTFIPEPGVKHAVYLLARTFERDYAEAADVLRVQSAGQTYAILVPTDRFVSDDLRRQTSSAGVPLIFLSEMLAFEPRQGFLPLRDPLSVFASVGHPISLESVPVNVVAEAYVKPRGQDGSWSSLDQAAYTSLLGACDSYDIFADERTRSVRRTDASGRDESTGVTPSHFKQIRSVIETRGFYDPVLADDASPSAKQIFQRARQTFDIERGRSWSIFKTRKVEKHAVYEFSPDPSVSFAFIFLPKA